MAQRPVFIATKDANLVSAEMVTFRYFNGFALCQKQKSIQSLHDAFLKLHPEKKVLEISSKSMQDDGIPLSAFNLKLNSKEGLIPVEILYHAAKCFENGGPYKDILEKTSSESKTDSRIKSSGKIIGYDFEGQRYPNNPPNFFYDWIYCKALSQNPDLVETLMKYDGFTDIIFNPKTGINCQARTSALYISLCHLGLAEEALKSPEDFLRIVFKKEMKFNVEIPKVVKKEELPPAKPVPKEEVELLGKKIVHNLYGIGSIVDVKNSVGNKRIQVKFENQEIVKKFVYPEILKFAKFCD